MLRLGCRERCDLHLGFTEFGGTRLTGCNVRFDSPARNFVEHSECVERGVVADMFAH